MRKPIYLILAIIGLIIPYFELIQFIIENWLNFKLLIEQLFQTHISSFFAFDVIISAIVLLLFVIYENKKRKIKYSWIAILGTFTVGVSFGLPLFLYFREK